MLVYIEKRYNIGISNELYEQYTVVLGHFLRMNKETIKLLVLKQLIQVHSISQSAATSIRYLIHCVFH